jgi:hypothetical protein
MKTNNLPKRDTLSQEVAVPCSVNNYYYGDNFYFEQIILFANLFN